MNKDLVELNEKWKKEDRWTIVYPILLGVMVLVFEVILLK